MVLEYLICRTCGVQCGDSEQPPSLCKICDDERQYIGWQGQQWATLSELAAEGHTNELRDIEPGLTGVCTQPRLAIGQRALLVQTAGGNLLWDCITYLDGATVERIRDLGGIQAISASHPHFYGTMIEWSRAFDDAPVYVPEDDREWIARPDPAIQIWRDSEEVFPGVTLIQCGGHFRGSAVVHWAAGAGGRGAILTGDTISVVRDRSYVSFMWSYPNLIPLPAAEVRRIADAVRPYEFDRIYGGWWHSVVERDGKAAVERSAERYAARLQSTPAHDDD